MVMDWWLIAVVTWFKWCSECDGGLWMLNQSNVTVRSHDLRPTTVVQYLTAPLHWGIPSSCVSWTTQAWNNIIAARTLSGQISKSAQNFVRAKLLNKVEKNRGNWFLFWVIHHRLFLFSKNKSLCLCFHWMIQWSESETVPPLQPSPTHSLFKNSPTKTVVQSTNGSPNTLLSDGMSHSCTLIVFDVRGWIEWFQNDSWVMLKWFQDDSRMIPGLLPDDPSSLGNRGQLAALKAQSCVTCWSTSDSFLLYLCSLLCAFTSFCSPLGALVVLFFFSRRLNVAQAKCCRWDFLSVTRSFFCPLDCFVFPFLFFPLVFLYFHDLRRICFGQIIFFSFFFWNVWMVH